MAELIITYMFYRSDPLMNLPEIMTPLIEFWFALWTIEAYGSCIGYNSMLVLSRNMKSADLPISMHPELRWSISEALMVAIFSTFFASKFIPLDLEVFQM